MKKNRKIMLYVGIILLGLLVVMGILGFVANNKLTNKKLLEEEKSLVSLQSDYEKEFKIGRAHV